MKHHCSTGTWMLLFFHLRKRENTLTPALSTRGQGKVINTMRKLFPHVENKHFDACVWIGTGSVWTSYPWQCRQQEGTNQFSAKPWLWAQLIIWVLTLFYVLRFYWKESGSWVLQDTSQSIRPVKCVFFLQKEEQILFILDHKEASQSPPHSLPMC